MKKIKILLTVLVLVTILAVNHSTMAATTTTAIDVTTYGATVNDTTDDTAKIQSAIYVAANTGQTVNIPAGNYYINPDVGLNLPSNTTLNFENGAKFSSLPSSKDSYNLVRVWGVSNVKITGAPTIVGDRDSHIGTSGEHGMGLSIRSSSNVYVENAYISDCWGDGIYIGDMGGSFQPYNKDVTIKNVNLDNNRRQGISVISAINLTIDSPVITNTNGTDPQSGIDFEPNNIYEYMQNVVVTNPVIQNNAKDGLHFWFGFNKGSVNLVSVNIVNSGEIKNNKNEDVYFSTTGLGAGQIMIDGKNLYLSGSPIIPQPDPSTIQPTVSDLQKQIDDLKAQNASLNTQITTLTDENTKLKNKLSGIQTILNQ